MLRESMTIFLSNQISCNTGHLYSIVQFVAHCASLSHYHTATIQQRSWRGPKMWPQTEPWEQVRQVWQPLDQCLPNQPAQKCLSNILSPSKGTLAAVVDFSTTLVAKKLISITCYNLLIAQQHLHCSSLVCSYMHFCLSLSISCWWNGLSIRLMNIDHYTARTKAWRSQPIYDLTDFHVFWRKLGRSENETRILYTLE